MRCDCDFTSTFTYDNGVDPPTSTDLRVYGDVTVTPDAAYNQWYVSGGPNSGVQITDEKSLVCPRTFEAGTFDFETDVLIYPLTAEGTNYPEPDTEWYITWSLLVDLSDGNHIKGDSSAGPFFPGLTMKLGNYNIAFFTNQEDRGPGADWVQFGTMTVLGQPSVPFYWDRTTVENSEISVSITGHLDIYLTVGEEWSFTAP